MPIRWRSFAGSRRVRQPRTLAAAAAGAYRRRMTETALETAVTRLERAIVRVERAGSAAPAPAADTLARLEQRHERLRARVEVAIERLDGMIAAGDAARGTGA